MGENTNCGIAKTIKVIGSKWTILILRDLFTGTKRFGQLEKSLQHISTKTLSLRLKQLEKDGIVTKKIFAEVPVRVEYALTPKGKSLHHIIGSLRDWGEKEA